MSREPERHLEAAAAAANVLPTSDHRFKVLCARHFTVPGEAQFYTYPLPGEVVREGLSRPYHFQRDLVYLALAAVLPSFVEEANAGAGALSPDALRVHIGDNLLSVFTESGNVIAGSPVPTRFTTVERPMDAEIQRDNDVVRQITDVIGKPASLDNVYSRARGTATTAGSGAQTSASPAPPPTPSSSSSPSSTSLLSLVVSRSPVLPVQKNLKMREYTDESRVDAASKPHLRRLPLVRDLLFAFLERQLAPLKSLALKESFDAVVYDYWLMLLSYPPGHLFWTYIRDMAVGGTRLTLLDVNAYVLAPYQDHTYRNRVTPLSTGAGGFPSPAAYFGSFARLEVVSIAGSGRDVYDVMSGVIVHMLTGVHADSHAAAAASPVVTQAMLWLRRALVNLVFYMLTHATAAVTPTAPFSEVSFNSDISVFPSFMAFLQQVHHFLMLAYNGGQGQGGHEPNLVDLRAQQLMVEQTVRDFEMLNAFFSEVELTGSEDEPPAAAHAAPTFMYGSSRIDFERNYLVYTGSGPRGVCRFATSEVGAPAQSLYTQMNGVTYVPKPFGWTVLRLARTLLMQPTLLSPDDRKVMTSYTASNYTHVYHRVPAFDAGAAEAHLLAMWRATQGLASAPYTGPASLSPAETATLLGIMQRIPWASVTRVQNTTQPGAQYVSVAVDFERSAGMQPVYMLATDLVRDSYKRSLTEVAFTTSVHYRASVDSDANAARFSWWTLSSSTQLPASIASWPIVHAGSSLDAMDDFYSGDIDAFPDAEAAPASISSGVVEVPDRVRLTPLAHTLGGLSFSDTDSLAPEMVQHMM